MMKRQGPLTLLRTSTRFRRWVIVAAALPPVLYVILFGPACWLTAPPIDEYEKRTRWMIVYWPIGALATKLLAYESPAGDVLMWWAGYAVPQGHALVVPTTASGASWIEFERPLLGGKG